MGWLFSGNDRALADQSYADRESASASASRKRRTGHRSSVTATARQGQAWEDQQRQQQDGGNWWRSSR
ncbi:hypothetical protein [Streptomyces niveus]|uniref:hypothetical protein n=1 Tax=Streptomyces niveus TaxID=193462 RepID=UPI0034500ACC